MIEGFQRVLVLGAHPDDEMGCAGLIQRLVRQGSRVSVTAFSRCEDLNGPELIYEWNLALMALGISDSEVFDLPNRRLPEHRAEVLEVLDHYRSEKPQLVLCPTTYDSHQDHSTVAAEAKRAFKDTTILGYELPLNSVNGSSLTAYVRLTPEAMDAKFAHAAAFRSQRAKAYMDHEFIEGLARVRGVQSGTKWAEGYEVIRWVL